MRLTVALALSIATTAVVACGGNVFTIANGDGPSDASVADSGGGPPPLDGSVDAPVTDSGPGPGNDGGPPSVDAGIDVAGTVVDAFLSPMPNVTVRIGSTQTTTDATGAFSFTNVPYPYTAIVLPPATSMTSGRHAYSFSGLNRVDPTFQLLFDAAPGTKAATIQGNATTGDTPGVVFADIAAPARAAGLNHASVVAATGDPFSLTAEWAGSSSTSAMLYNLQWVAPMDGGVPSAFIAYSSEATTLTNGQTTTWPVMVSNVLNNGSLPVSVSVTPGYGLVYTALYVRPTGAAIAAPIGAMTLPPANVTLPTPEIPAPGSSLPGATFVVCAVQGLLSAADADAGSNTPYGIACNAGLGPSQATQLTPPPATTWVSPPSTASIATTFTWNAISNGVSLAVFAPVTATDPTFYALTGAGSVRIPDVSLFGAGLSLRSGAQYRATVYGLAPFAHIGDACGTSGYGNMLVPLQLSQGPAADGQVAFSGAAPFTVQ